MRLFHRAFNKSGIKIKYSQGFNPQPKFSIANPLSLGIESEEEYMDIELEEKISIKEFMEKINEVLPKDVQILDAKYIKKGKSLGSIISWAFYEIKFLINENLEEKEIEKDLINYLEKKEILILKTRKKGRRKVETQVNIRDFISNVVVKEYKNNIVTLEAMLKSGGNGNLKPVDFISSLKKESNINIDMDSLTIRRLELYAEEKSKIYKPL